MAKLIVHSGGNKQEYELGQMNTLGRHPGNTIQILDRIISKEHAQIIRSKDGQYLLRDLGSLNGTYIGGQRVGEHMLKHGDEMVMGSTHITYLEYSDKDSSLHNVTFAPGVNDSHIRQKIDTTHSRDFLPEKEIQDAEMLRRDYEKLRISHALSTAIVGVFELDELLPTILEKTLQLLPADRAVILLVEGDGRLVPRHVKHRRPGREDEQVILSNSVLNEVMLQKRAVLSSDAMMDSRFSGAHSIIMQGIRSTMCVPMLHGEELLGIMHMDSQLATGAFTEKDLQLFTAIANQAAVAIQNARLAQKITEETKTRAQFQRLLSPNLVEQLVKGDLKLERGGELREVTILISDIRGFTAMSEKKPPADIVAMLNEYFEVMVEVLFRHEGTLDKYVGDELMALFGAPVPMANAPLAAIKCALDMRKALHEFNRMRVAENQEPIRIGIGVNTGMVVTGAIGSTKTLQYTAIGDAVNTASRLCGTAKAGEIILSETTMKRVADFIEVQTLAPVKLKGKAEPLPICNVLGMKGELFEDDGATSGH